MVVVFLDHHVCLILGSCDALCAPSPFPSPWDLAGALSASVPRTATPRMTSFGVMAKAQDTFHLANTAGDTASALGTVYCVVWGPSPHMACERDAGGSPCVGEYLRRLSRHSSCFSLHTWRRCTLVKHFCFHIHT